jgi:starvation-inducible DNA-binding protein
MAAVTGPLTDEARKVTGDALQSALVDLVDLSLSAKQAHWNLIGPHFRSLHLQLDDIVDIARKHMDIVAERAVAIGVNPDGRAETIAKSAHSKQLPDGYVHDHDVIEFFTSLLADIVQRFRTRVRDTDEPDPVTQDLLIAATQDLEQQHWMIQAQK